MSLHSKSCRDSKLLLARLHLCEVFGRHGGQGDGGGRGSGTLAATRGTKSLGALGLLGGLFGGNQRGDNTKALGALLECLDLLLRELQARRNVANAGECLRNAEWRKRQKYSQHTGVGTCAAIGSGLRFLSALLGATLGAAAAPFGAAGLASTMPNFWARNFFFSSSDRTTSTPKRAAGAQRKHGMEP